MAQIRRKVVPPMRVILAVAASLAALALPSYGRADEDYAPNFSAPSVLSMPPAQFGGVEFGLDLGGGWGSTGSYTSSGIEGGGHVGYNFQFGGFVAGIEADALVGNVSASVTGSSTITTNWLDSLHGRAGYAFGPWLAYGELGGAFSTMTYSNPIGSFNNSIGGYMFGLGGEYALTRNISFRGELRRYNMDTATYYLPAETLTGSTSQTMALFGVSGRF
jgi:outer membrane immunogenic protein